MKNLTEFFKKKIAMLKAAKKAARRTEIRRNRELKLPLQHDNEKKTPRAPITNRLLSVV